MAFKASLSNMFGTPQEEDGLLEVLSSPNGGNGGAALVGVQNGNGGGGVVLAGAHHSIMYAPRCLVLVSTLDCFTTFRV